MVADGVFAGWEVLWFVWVSRGVVGVVCTTLETRGEKGEGGEVLTGCGGARWGSKGLVEGSSWPESTERMVWKTLGRGVVPEPWWVLRGTLAMVVDLDVYWMEGCFGVVTR